MDTPARLPDGTGCMPTLLEKFRLTILAKHYSRRTRTAYESWIRRYIKYHRNRHPKDMGGP